MSGMTIPDNWTFKDASVAEHFAEHVREQLPWYSLATDAVAHVVRHYLPKGGIVYDIGASEGNIGRAIAPTLAARNAYLVAVEESPDMVARYNAPGEVVASDALSVDFRQFDVGVLFLVLMFMGVEDRKTLLTRLWGKLNRGGCLVIFDKIHQPGGYAGTVLRRLTMSWKLNQGAKPEAILSKELSLAGVQRPLRPDFLTELGLPHRVFFVFGEFAGWLVEKPE